MSECALAQWASIACYVTALHTGRDLTCTDFKICGADVCLTSLVRMSLVLYPPGIWVLECRTGTLLVSAVSNLHFPKHFSQSNANYKEMESARKQDSKLEAFSSL